MEEKSGANFIALRQLSEYASSKKYTVDSLKKEVAWAPESTAEVKEKKVSDRMVD